MSYRFSVGGAIEGGCESILKGSAGSKGGSWDAYLIPGHVRAPTGSDGRHLALLARAPRLPPTDFRKARNTE